MAQVTCRPFHRNREALGGPSTAYDATMVCLDWHGGPPRDRTTQQGADPNRASPGA
ncbi:MAG TPA: hypothetical protein VHH34_23425 [Pseudonocardiaceae bacterium]|nr:hypothetical protein [Pseudonocardiaceae bacterium]